MASAEWARMGCGYRPPHGDVFFALFPVVLDKISLVLEIFRWASTSSGKCTRWKSKARPLWLELDEAGNGPDRRFFELNSPH